MCDGGKDALTYSDKKTSSRGRGVEAKSDQSRARVEGVWWLYSGGCC